MIKRKVVSGFVTQKINIRRRPHTMTIKDLMEQLRKFNQDAEVCVGLDLKSRSNETIPASIVHPLHDKDDVHYIGFSRILNKKKDKKNIKKIVIY